MRAFTIYFFLSQISWSDDPPARPHGSTFRASLGYPLNVIQRRKKKVLNWIRKCYDVAVWCNVFRTFEETSLPVSFGTLFLYRNEIEDIVCWFGMWGNRVSLASSAFWRWPQTIIVSFFMLTTANAAFQFWSHPGKVNRRTHGREDGPSINFDWGFDRNKESMNRGRRRLRRTRRATALWNKDSREV